MMSSSHLISHHCCRISGRVITKECLFIYNSGLYPGLSVHPAPGAQGGGGGGGGGHGQCGPEHGDQVRTETQLRFERQSCLHKQFLSMTVSIEPLLKR